jgi:hypothetical protein
MLLRSLAPGRLPRCRSEERGPDTQPNVPNRVEALEDQAARAPLLHAVESWPLLGVFVTHSPNARRIGGQHSRSFWISGHEPREESFSRRQSPPGSALRGGEGAPTTLTERWLVCAVGCASVREFHPTAGPRV